MTPPKAPPESPEHPRCDAVCPNIFPPITCQLEPGHPGPHQGPGGTPWWMKDARTQREMAV